MKKISFLLMCSVICFWACSDDNDGTGLIVPPITESEDTYRLTNIYFYEHNLELKECEELTYTTKVSNHTSVTGEGEVPIDDFFVNTSVFTVASELPFDPKIEERVISIPLLFNEDGYLIYEKGIFSFKEQKGTETEKTVTIQHEIPPLSAVTVEYYRKYNKTSVPYSATLKGINLEHEIEIYGVWESNSYIGGSTFIETIPLEDN